MSFYKTANLILEESGEKPEFEKLNPKKYPLAYIERIDGSLGSIVRVKDNGTVDVLEVVDPNEKRAKEMKESWLKASVYPGYRIAFKVGFSNDAVIKKYGIIASYDFYYIVRDDIAEKWREKDISEKDITIKLPRQIQGSEQWWLKSTYLLDYTPSHVSKDMDQLMSTL